MGVAELFVRPSLLQFDETPAEASPIIRPLPNCDANADAGSSYETCRTNLPILGYSLTWEEGKVVGLFGMVGCADKDAFYSNKCQ